ncbi:hypothetical protein [Bacteroides sedimenti]|uniref:ATP-binding protein n=1 Tax=Bacteroides sedimenti TaxID=2136147 RepID=A0ABN6Z1A5_9BACE
MNKKTIGCLLLTSLAFFSCKDQKKANVDVAPVSDSAKVISDHLHFCEATCWNDDSLYISNFGGDTINPLNKLGKGYIMKFTTNKPTVLIPADGRLNAPKGMCVVNQHLFVADVNAVMVFDLRNTKKSQKISFPANDSFVNDIAVCRNNMYITVTNTGNVYKLDVSAPEKMNEQALKLFAKVPGANGIVATDSIIYVASYPVDGNTKEENVIYTIQNFEKPIVRKLFDRKSQYDGLVLSEDGKSLYFTTWVNGNVGKINLKDMTVEKLKLPIQLTGPADMSMHKGKLYIPDLPNSRVLVY